MDNYQTEFNRAQLKLLFDLITEEIATRNEIIVFLSKVPERIAKPLRTLLQNELELAFRTKTTIHLALCEMEE